MSYTEQVRRVKKLLKAKYGYDSRINSERYSSGGGGRLVHIDIFVEKPLGIEDYRSLVAALELELADVYNPSVYLNMRDKNEDYTYVRPIWD